MKVVAPPIRAPWLVTLALAAVVAPGAGRASAVDARATATCVIAAPASAGMIVALDPETGLPGSPTAEQVARLAGKLRSSRTLAHASQVHRPDGTVKLDVRSWMRDFSIVRLGPAGRPALGCYDDLATALGAKAAPTPALEER